MERTCIWCSKSEPLVKFNKKAHTVPQALGGKNICENVCDDCNAFFGNVSNRAPAVETVIKETFNITRARLLSSLTGVGKNKSMARFKSTYFKVDFEKRKMGIKPQYKFNKYFQATLGRQLKKGLYKIFLEETERQRTMGHNSQFDFIREFSRYDLGDYPVIYFERMHGMIMISQNWVDSPEMFLMIKCSSNI
jgi:hypothetical protein